MSTPQDRQRTEAFRAWLKHIGSIEAAHAATGIATRSIERMRAGKKPAPVRLLQALALLERRRAPEIAKQLMAAQMPPPGIHGLEITGIWFDEAEGVRSEPVPPTKPQRHRVLHVDPVMFGRMCEHELKADFYGLDPAIAALAPTGIDWKDLGCETRVVVDLATPEDRPDGLAELGEATDA